MTDTDDSQRMVGWYEHALTTDHDIYLGIGEPWHCKDCPKRSPVPDDVS